MLINKRIGIIGCGNMGEAIFSRLSLIMDKSTELMVTEMSAKRRDTIQDKYKIIVGIDNNYLVKYCDVIIIAVKPQDLEELLNEEVCCGVSKDKLIISIAAGVTIKHIEKIVGKDVPVIRVMPNLPAIVGQGMSAIAAGSAASKEHMEVANFVFSKVGDVVEVDESLLDAVTAISGSGPGYLFYIMDAIIDSAKKLKIDRKTATKLVVKTIIGSAELADKLSKDPKELCDMVKSKGGTTEAAIKVFDKKKLKKIISEATSAAYKRSKELSRG